MDDDLDDDGISSKNGWGKDSIEFVRMDSNREMTFLLYLLTRYFFFFFFFYLPVPCRRNNRGKLLVVFVVVVVLLENLLGTRGRN